MQLPFSWNLNLKSHNAFNLSWVIFSVARFGIKTWASWPLHSLESLDEIYLWSASLSGLIRCRCENPCNPRTQVGRTYVSIILLAFFVQTFYRSWSFRDNNLLLNFLYLKGRPMLNLIILVTECGIIPILPFEVLIDNFSLFLRDYLFRLLFLTTLLYELILISFWDIWLLPHWPTCRITNILFVIQEIMCNHAPLCCHYSAARCDIARLLQKFWFRNINFLPHFQIFK